MTSIIFFFIFVPILAVILLGVNFLLAPHNPYKEKKTPFECGYHSFLSQNRTQFTISFFIFGLLFLLFDLEIVLIYPYTVSSYANNIYGLIFMLAFTLIVTVGFIFELGKKALSIESKQSTNLNQERNIISQDTKKNNFDEKIMCPHALESSLWPSSLNFLFITLMNWILFKIYEKVKQNINFYLNNVEEEFFANAFKTNFSHKIYHLNSFIDNYCSHINLFIQFNIFISMLNINCSMYCWNLAVYCVIFIFVIKISQDIIPSIQSNMIKFVFEVLAFLALIYIIYLMFDTVHVIIDIILKDLLNWISKLYAKHGNSPSTNSSNMGSGDEPTGSPNPNNRDKEAYPASSSKKQQPESGFEEDSSSDITDQEDNLDEATQPDLSQFSESTHDEVQRYRNTINRNSHRKKNGYKIEKDPLPILSEEAIKLKRMQDKIFSDKNKDKRNAANRVENKFKNTLNPEKEKKEFYEKRKATRKRAAASRTEEEQKVFLEKRNSAKRRSRDKKKREFDNLSQEQQTEIKNAESTKRKERKQKAAKNKAIKSKSSIKNILNE